MPDDERLKLPEEARRRMENMTVDIENARKAVETMKKIGMDTRQIEDKLHWAEETRQILLSEFD